VLANFTFYFKNRAEKENCKMLNNNKRAFFKEWFKRFSLYLTFDLPIMAFAFLVGWLAGFSSLASMLAGFGLITLFLLVITCAGAFLVTFHAQPKTEAA